MAKFENDPDDVCRSRATHFVMPGVFAIILAFVALFIAPFAADDQAIAEEANTTPIASLD